MQLLRQGLVADAVRASCSIPGVFVPRELAGRELVDGGLVSPLPVRRRTPARCRPGAGRGPDNAAAPLGVPGSVRSDPAILRDHGPRLSDSEARLADLVLRPDTGAYSSTDFSVRREMIQVGQESMRALLPEWSRRLERPVPATAVSR